MAAVLAGVILLASVGWFYLCSTTFVTFEAYQSVGIGMSRMDVEGVLGRPGGTRDEFVTWLNNRSPSQGPGIDLLNQQRDLSGIEYWYQDSGIVIVRFDGDNQVAAKQFLSVEVSTVHQKVNRIREWLGW